MEKVLEFENGKIRVIIEMAEETEPEVQSGPMSEMQEHLARMWKPILEEQLKATSANRERRAKLAQEINVKKHILKNLLDDNQPISDITEYNDMLEEYRILERHRTHYIPPQGKHIKI